MNTEGITNGAEAAGFKTPNRFSVNRGETRDAAPMGALSYLNENPGSPKDKPSYYRQTYGGFYGVQVRDAARNDQGYRTFEEVRK